MLSGQGQDLKWWQWLRFKARQLKQQAVALYYAMQDPRVGWLPRLFIVIVLGYALSPIDLIPDFIPILGILDDVILLPAMFWLTINLIPQPVMQRASQRAKEEPLRLSKNWFTAIVIFLLWDMAALGGTAFCCHKFGSVYWQKKYWILLIAIGSVLFVTELSWGVWQCVSEQGMVIEELTDADNGTDFVQGTNIDHTTRLLDGYAESNCA